MRADPRTKRPSVLAVAGAVLISAAASMAQQSNPVFVDDSTLAADILEGLPGLIASGNEAEAVRLLQRLLDEEADRLVVSGEDEDLFETVRDRVHRELLSRPALLDRYRRSQTARAQNAIERGRHDSVESAMLLTRPGFIGALRVAAAHLSAGRFESARMTLDALEAHPDADDPRLASDAASLSAQVGAYLAREDQVERTRRWADRAGVDAPPVQAVEWPEELTERRHSPRLPGGRLSVETLVGTPLRSVDLNASASADQDVPIRVTRRSRQLYELPFLFPLVVGDTIYTTDGLWVSAWDRFTLAERWRTKPRGADHEREVLEEIYATPAARQRHSRDIEESTVLATSGRLLVTATGFVSDGSRTGDPRLHALDRVTGRVLWSTYIDELDAQLEEASSRGPAVFEGDVAVIAVRKVPQARRFASAYLVGIDLANGSARWVRLCGSAGWLSYGGRGQWSDWPAVHEGVVYRVDELGVICAIEAGTGRVRWVRRLSGVESRMPMMRKPWTASTPLFDGDTLITLSPDRRFLLRMELATGRVVETRNAAELGRPAYIFRNGDDLVAVGESRVAVLPFGGAFDAPVRISPLEPDPGIMGRVVSAGSSLLIPVVGGFRAADTDALGDARAVSLEEGGNLIALDDQLLTIENASLHSYLVWDRAAEDLAARLDADPNDVSTAVTFAELAYRAGHPEAVLGPTDRALAAMGAMPEAAAVRPGQDRLFGLLMEMLDADAREPILDAVGRDEVVSRLGRVARSADQRASHLLTRASVLERAGRPAEALADCQAVVSDASLAEAAWRRSASEVRAQIEAFERIDALLLAHGPALYEQFDLEASRRLDGLISAGGTSSEFAAVATLYPRAARAPEAWLASADANGAGSALARDRALARGLETGLESHTLGVAVDEAVVGELAGRRLASLLASRRLRTAEAVLLSLEERWPGLRLTEGGDPLDRALLASDIGDRMRERTAKPVISAEIAGDPVALGGWTILRPIDRTDAHARRDGVMLLAAGQVAMWAASPEGPARRWSHPCTRRPVLLRFDPDRVLFYEPDDTGGTVYALRPSDGEELWRTGSIGEALARAEGARPVVGRERFEVPLDGTVLATDPLFVFDEGIISIVSRAGRALGIDLESGRIAWARRTECLAVHDAAAGDGVLVLAGTAMPDEAHEAGEQVVAMHDLADGLPLSRYVPTAGKVRWVQMAPSEHRAIVGLSQGLVGLSAPDARVDWTMSDAVLSDSSGGWVFGESMFLITQMQELAMIDIADGRVVEQRLDTRGRLDRGNPIDVVPDGERLMILGPAGAAIIGRSSGALIGADAVQQFDRLVQPVLGEGLMVIFERDPVAGAPGLYRFHILESQSGRSIAQRTVQLERAPTRAALSEGAIFVTTGDRTIVLGTALSDL